MFSKFPERFQSNSIKDIKKLSSSSSCWQALPKAQKRLKSLELKTSIQNRHLQSYQIFPLKSVNDVKGGQLCQEPERAASVGTAIIGISDTDSTFKLNELKGKEFSSFSLAKGTNNKEHEYSQSAVISPVQPIYQQLQSTQVSQMQQSPSKKNCKMQVFVRVRPLNQREYSGKNLGRKMLKVIVEEQSVIIDQNISLNQDGMLNLGKCGVKEDKVFEMNGVFGEYISNQEVFINTMKSDIRESLFEGFNCTCFVYGMTGAGKTYTMFGDISGFYDPGSINSVQGLIILALKEMLTFPNDKKHKIKVSFLEIYNESIRDLLSPEGGENLMVVEDSVRGVFVPGLIEKDVSNEQSVLELIRIGNTRREMASTGQNEFSSRSHAIFTFYLEQTTSSTSSDQQDKQNRGSILTTSKLCLVDLAGSERIASTENKGIRLVEGANINKSLLALGNCINILSDTKKKGAFVPYRDSKLTRYLKDSLGGNTKTCMIACVSPALVSLDETINTLKYAQRARKIEKTLTKNTLALQPQFQSSNSAYYLEMIEAMKNEINHLRSQLASQQPLTQNKPAKLLPKVLQLANFQKQSQAVARTTANCPIIELTQPDFLSTDFRKDESIQGSPFNLQEFDGFAESESNNYRNINESNFNNNERDYFKDSDNQKFGIQNIVPTLMSQDSNESSVVEAGGANRWNHESFSSSGKSIHISCTNASNNGSVVLFKRSPSQLSLSKQTEALKQKTAELIEELSGRMLKNLEENWEIKQSILDLKSLKKQNEEILIDKQSKLAQLRTQLIQWPYENKRTDLLSQISQLEETMKNNEAVLQALNSSLNKNEENKSELLKDMTHLLAGQSELRVNSLAQTCQALQIEKNDLENSNLEMKQQHLKFKNQFKQKISQIKTMEEQIKQMSKQLQEKNSIISQNQQLIGHLSSPSNLTTSSIPLTKSNFYSANPPSMTANSIQLSSHQPSTINSTSSSSQSASLVNGLRFLNVNPTSSDSKNKYSDYVSKNPIFSPQVPIPSNAALKSNLSPTVCNSGGSFFISKAATTVSTITNSSSINGGGISNVGQAFKQQSQTNSVNVPTNTLSQKSEMSKVSQNLEQSEKAGKQISHTHCQSEPVNSKILDQGTQKVTQSLSENIEIKLNNEIMGSESFLIGAQKRDKLRQGTSEANRMQMTKAIQNSTNSNNSSFLFSQSNQQQLGGNIFRSTSSSSTSNKNLILERSGYFDLKNKQSYQQQQQSSLNYLPKDQSLQPFQYKINSTNNKPKSFTAIETIFLQPSTQQQVSPAINQGENRDSLAQPAEIVSCQTLYSLAQSSARLTSQAQIQTGSALPQSSVNKKDVLTQREKQQQFQSLQLLPNKNQANQNLNLNKNVSINQYNINNNNNNLSINQNSITNAQQNISQANKQDTLALNNSKFLTNTQSKIQRNPDNSYQNNREINCYASWTTNMNNTSNGNINTINQKASSKVFENNSSILGITNQFETFSSSKTTTKTAFPKGNNLYPQSQIQQMNNSKEFINNIGLNNHFQTVSGQEETLNYYPNSQKEDGQDFIDKNEFPFFSKSAQQSPQRIIPLKRQLETKSKDNSPSPRKSMNSFIVNPILTASTFHQKQATPSFSLMQNKPQFQQIGLNQFTYSSSSSSSSLQKDKVNQSQLGKGSTVQKESNIVTPDQSLISIHKIDLYKTTLNNKPLDDLLKIEDQIKNNGANSMTSELAAKINEIILSLSPPNSIYFTLTSLELSILQRLQDGLLRFQRQEIPSHSQTTLQSHRAKSSAYIFISFLFFNTFYYQNRQVFQTSNNSLSSFNNYQNISNSNALLPDKKLINDSNNLKNPQQQSLNALSTNISPNNFFGPLIFSPQTSESDQSQRQYGSFPSSITSLNPTNQTNLQNQNQNSNNNNNNSNNNNSNSNNIRNVIHINLYQNKGYTPFAQTQSSTTTTSNSVSPNNYIGQLDYNPNPLNFVPQSDSSKSILNIFSQQQQQQQQQLTKR